jgi:hypothetical protein
MITAIVLLVVLLVVCVGIIARQEVERSLIVEQRETARTQRDEVEARHERLLDVAAGIKGDLLRAHRTLRQYGYDGALPVPEEVSPAAEGRVPQTGGTGDDPVQTNPHLISVNRIHPVNPVNPQGAP